VGECIHFVGIGGAGMSGMARVLARQGVAVTGSDLKESATLESLRRESGIRAEAGHEAAHLNGATLVVASAAIKKDNAEVVAAREKGIPIISRAEMLGRLMARYPRSVAISGTHGKTTTTGMAAMVLEAGHLDPTVLIGGDLPAYGGNARLGKSDVFLAEACEAYDSFLDLDPQIAVITNIEADHLDYYGDLNNVLRSFKKFLLQVTGTAILCGYDPNVRALTEELRATPGAPQIVTFGLYPDVTLRAVDVDPKGAAPSYTAVWHGETLGRVTLNVPGMHNIANSLAALAVGLTLGVSFAQAARGLNAFTGTGRRFERLGETNSGAIVVDDYAHHPTEIRATLAAARQAYPDRRLVAVFQPHLPSRTRDFKTEFAESFSDADHVVLTDIFLAREAPLEGVTGAGLAALTADRRGAEHVTYVADKNAIPSRLADLVQPGDVVLTLGAGDIRTVGEKLLSDFLPAPNSGGVGLGAVLPGSPLAPPELGAGGSI
jgi:UDP-N-acetylmuramate--alanine ligase